MGKSGSGMLFSHLRILWVAVLVLSFNTWQRGEKCINVGQRGDGVALREATEEDGGRGGGKHRFALLWGELPP